MSWVNLQKTKISFSPRMRNICYVIFLCPFLFVNVVKYSDVWTIILSRGTRSRSGGDNAATDRGVLLLGFSPASASPLARRFPPNKGLPTRTGQPEYRSTISTSPATAGVSNQQKRLRLSPTLKSGRRAVSSFPAKGNTFLARIRIKVKVPVRAK